MTALVYGLIYAGVLVFAAACVVRTVRYATLPAHLRWELYPVPHEEARLAEHGGSYFETLDWWTQKRHYSLAGELKVMLPEVFFLKALWEFNRKLWYRSFPFHFGLYLLASSAALLLLSTLQAAFMAPLSTLLTVLYRVTGVLGAALAIGGAAGLLHRRLTDIRLRNFTTPGDIFNLAFFIVTLGLLLSGYFTRPAGAPDMRTMARGILTFDASLRLPALLAVGFSLGALLLAYIPLTHMAHFIAKYFTYHHIRWDDVPAAKSAELRKKCAEYLTYRPTWAARHIAGDGTKTWAEIATTNPFTGAKK